MNVPSEEILQSIISEIQTDQQAEHKDKITDAKCEFCQLNEIFDKVNQIYETKGEQNICVIDKIGPSIAQGIPVIGITVMLGGPGMMEYISACNRFAFLVGMKAERARAESEKLKDLI